MLPFLGSLKFSNNFRGVVFPNQLGRYGGNLPLVYSNRRDLSRPLLETPSHNPNLHVHSNSPGSYDIVFY